MKRVEVVPYNAAWPRYFEAESTNIKNILASRCIAVHHIGSTAVPGLPAKDKIDILCVVDKLDAAFILESIGYIFKGEYNVPLRYYFTKKTAVAKINLHVVEEGHGFIALNLCFRDFVRGAEDAKREYAQLKADLLLQPESHLKRDNILTGYNLGKNDFIKKMLNQAGFEGVVINYCMHFTEWNEYHRIKKEQIFDRINIVYDRQHPTLLGNNQFHFVLYKGAKIVTVAHVELWQEGEAVLRGLATDGPYQGKGFGKIMIKFLEKWLKSRGKHTLKIHAALRAEQFYRKLGYIEMEFNDPSITPEVVNLGKEL